MSVISGGLSDAFRVTSETVPGFHHEHLPKHPHPPPQISFESPSDYDTNLEYPTPILYYSNLPRASSSVNVEPLTVDSIQIFAGQRYSFVLTADQPVSNYWIRTVANSGTTGFDNGINSAILRLDPTTNSTTSVIPMVETSLHPLVATPVPGTHEVGAADVALNFAITLNVTSFAFDVNCVSFVPPTVPVLLQILSGAHTAAELLPTGSVYILPPNLVIEISVPGGTPGAPHPFHLHGKRGQLDVIRDVVSTGPDTTDNTTIRFQTDNAGPWFLHCHIDFHLELGLAIVFAEDTDTIANSVQPSAWDILCPTYDALTSSQLGGER
ncbi:Laccase, multicopper oxidase, benzenediol:oxygen oxidorectuctase [Mycena sanguinolenta]|uniref:laccase n=1 Tax=Mycena sanguinolenta TaxID=230812 RepID=A0A8H6YKS8_9AGAR|nr:Laccase, multicopper oxidase, benzenediol:oxygen oxidorectuctase [Mycena sanguinolenta]